MRGRTHSDGWPPMPIIHDIIRAVRYGGRLTE